MSACVLWKEAQNRRLMKKGSADGASVQVSGKGADQEGIAEGKCGPGNGLCTGEKRSERETASSSMGRGEKKSDAGKRISPVAEGDSGRPVDAEREVGHACAGLENARRHWENLNFFPVYNLVYANPNKTPRAYRFKEGHLLKVTSKKCKEETGVAEGAGTAGTSGVLGASGVAGTAGASGASGSAGAAGASVSAGAEEAEGVSGVAGAAREAGAAGFVGAAEAEEAEGAGGPLRALDSGAAGRQQGQEAALVSEGARVGGETAQHGTAQAAAWAGGETSLCTEVEARCRVTDTISAEPPTVSDGMVEAQGEGTARWKGKGEEEESVRTQGGSSAESAGELGSAVAGQVAMVELMERALAHRLKADALLLQGNTLEAGLECTRGCRALEGAPLSAEQLPERIMLVFQGLKGKLGDFRNGVYVHLVARAEMSRQKKLLEECLMRLLRDCLNLLLLNPTCGPLYSRAALALLKLGNTAAAMELLSRAEEVLYVLPRAGAGDTAELFPGGDAQAVEARRARGRAALQQALEAWEARLGDDEEWLLMLKSDPVASMALGNP